MKNHKQGYVIFFTSIKPGDFHATIPVFEIDVTGTTKDETTALAHQAVRDKFPNATIHQDFYGGTVTVPNET